MDQPPKRLPLVQIPSNRDTSTRKDARLVNCYGEKRGENEYHVYRRPGLSAAVSLAVGAGMGVRNWNGDIYAVVGGTFYKNGVNTGAVDATGGVYRFNQGLGATPQLYLSNGKEGYTYDSGVGLVNITDAQYPAVTVKGSAYLDGTLYVMTPQAEIYGSDINVFQSWDALNKIIAQSNPDAGIAVAKQLSYVVAMKEWTTEFFYDAANATGSPLSPVTGAQIPFGCASADSIQDIEGTLVWLATNRSASPQVMRMENLKPSIISSPAEEKLIQSADLTAIESWWMRQGGHTFYFITFKNDNLTMVYDLNEGLWFQATDASGNYFPGVSSTYAGTTTHYVQHATNGKIYSVSNTFNNDDGQLITADIITPNFDGGTNITKTLYRMEIEGDQVPGSILQVRVSDDDYQTWSNWRQINMGNQRKYLDDCGSFSNRAMHFRHRMNTAFRVSGVDLTLGLGEV